jgi:hypothetical protein
MIVVASSVFRCVQFPHQGKMVTIDQLDYCTPNSHNQTTNNIPFLGDSKITYESVGVGILKYSSLMGTFPTPVPHISQHIATINMILTMVHQSLESSDPWIVPIPLEFNTLGDTMPLSLSKVEYEAIQSTSPSPDDQHLLVYNSYSLPSWLDSLSSTFDYILQIFPSDESIMEMLNIKESPWDDNHQHSSFLPILDEIEKDISSIFPMNIVNDPQYSILTQDKISKGNLGNITQTISVDISKKEGVVENIQLGVNCSTKKIENYTTVFKEFHDIFHGAMNKF